MSAKRSAIRREKKIRDKIDKKAKHGDVESIIKQAWVKGYDHGCTVSTAIIFTALSDMYNFCHLPNGKGKLDKLMNQIRLESSKMSEAPTHYTVEHYVRLLKEQTGLDFGAGIMEEDAKREGAYNVIRDTAEDD